MHKVHLEIDVFGTLTAADRAFRPGDARLIVGEDRTHRSRCRLGISKIS